MANLEDRINELLMNGGEGGRHLSLQEFAERVNAVEVDGAAKILKSTVKDIKDGNRQPGYKVIIKIAKAFNVSCDYLMGVSDIPNTTNDDINLAAQTTGLSTNTVELLSLLKKVGNPEVITEAIGLLVKDAFSKVEFTSWDNQSMKISDIEWSTPAQPQAYSCFLSDYYNLHNAQVLSADDPSVSVTNLDLMTPSGKTIEAPRDIWVTYYSNQTLQHIMDLASRKRKQITDFMIEKQKEILAKRNARYSKKAGSTATNDKKPRKKK